MPHNKTHKEEEEERKLRFGEASNVKKFKVGDEFVTEEEFKAARGAAGFKGGSRGEIVTPETTELLRRTGFIPQTEQEKAAELTAATRLAEEERNKGLIPEIIPPAEQPVQELDPVTGEPLLSGAVSPVTPGDITNIATLGSGAVAVKAVKVGGKFALDVSKNAATAAAAKTTIGSSLKSIGSSLKNNAVKFGIGAAATVFGASKLIGTPKRRLQNIDTSQSQYREAITMPLEAVRVARLDPLEGIETLQEYEDQMNDYGRQLNEMTIVKLTELDEQVVDAAIVRNNKIIGFLDNAQFILQTSQVSGEAVNNEEVALLIESMRNFERSLK